MRTYKLSEQILYVLATYMPMSWAGALAVMCGVAFILGSLTGCMVQQWTPEEQAAMIKRCEENNLKPVMGDWGHIACTIKDNTK